MSGLTEKEEWRPVAAFPGYVVSSAGRVRRLADRHGKVRNLKLSVHTRGYLTANLMRDKTSSKILAHRLVADAFIQNPFGYPCINHINAIKSDNRVGNLEWVTHQMNSDHASKHGLYQTGERHHNAKLSDADVATIIDLKKRGHTKATISRQFGVSTRTVKAITNGHAHKSHPLLAASEAKP